MYNVYVPLFSGCAPCEIFRGFEAIELRLCLAEREARGCG